MTLPFGIPNTLKNATTGNQNAKLDAQSMKKMGLSFMMITTTISPTVFIVRFLTPNSTHIVKFTTVMYV